MDIDGDRLEEIKQTSHSLIYRGVNKEDNVSVILKLIRQKYPSLEIINRYQQEYAIINCLNCSGVIKAYNLIRYKNRLAIVLEDFPAPSLKDIIKNQTLAVKEILAIAIQITQALDNIHKAKIIHKDLNPSNILWNQSTQELKIIDFGIATQLPEEQKSMQNCHKLEGTLAYISPEQTGRMNRGLDYHSDYYSLGITLYELLTQQLPFQSQKPMELIYAHLAKIPLSPQEIKPEIPQAVSDIVMKLIEKNAEDRYQSAAGLIWDLEICLQQLQNNGEIKTFSLGTKDQNDRFIIPDKLYGRETEVKVLLDSFERVAQGSSELMLVAGFSGIGKTAVINEIHQPITRQQGYFIKGKFAQFNCNTPFSAFVRAFSSLTRQLLGESDQKLALWKEKILKVLGNNGKIIIDVIPELEMIIGKQPMATKLSGSAAENRFNLLFTQFILVFSQKEYPLVIFLDDLQWADSASLKLIKLLIEDLEAEYLLILGAYRDNEVYAAHPLMLTLEAIRRSLEGKWANAQSQAQFNTITLNPLSQESINNLISDSLCCENEAAKSLTEFVYRYTKGNPFFTKQFLRELYEKNCLEFDGSQQAWQYDLSQISNLQLSDDVVHFMVARLQQLPAETQAILQLAACIGIEFELATLSLIYEQSELELTHHLWSALQARLIIPETKIYRLYNETGIQDTFNNSSIKYRFLHDRVQQAAYSLITEEQKQLIHLKIGRLLLANLADQQREERLFEIINHINIGIVLISQSQEREELAQLNLIAGQKAKAATAYDTAITYFSTGIELLPANAWNKNYLLTLSLHEEIVETSYLNTDFEQMEQWAEIVLNNAKTLPDKIKVQQTLITGAIVQGKLLSSLQIGLKVLESLGIKFPSQPTEKNVEQTLSQTKALWHNQSIASLLELPEMKDPQLLGIMEILTVLVPTAFIVVPQLTILLICKQIELSLQWGNSTASIMSYSDYGLVLCGTIDECENGYQFGQLALKLLEKLQAKSFKCRCLYVVNTHTRHWKCSLSEIISSLEEAYAIGLETGDLFSLNLSKLFHALFTYHAGQNLAQVLKVMEDCAQIITEYKQTICIDDLKIYQQVVQNLLGQNTSPQILAGEILNQTTFLPQLQAKNHRIRLFFWYFNQTFLAYLFDEIQEAANFSAQAVHYLDSNSGFFQTALYSWYDALIQLARLTKITIAKERQSILFQINQQQEKLYQWARLAPMNHQHRWELVEAEKFRILAQHYQAGDGYDRAIHSAKTNGFIQDEALANELAAKFYLDWGKEKIAAGYMQEAYDCYDRWGAKAKTKHLEENYPELLYPILRSKNYSFNPLETLSSFSSLGKDNHQNDRVALSSINDTFDLTAILQSTRALTETLELDQLLNQLSQIILQNSGCDRLIIALQDNTGGWQINVNGDNKDIEIDCNLLEIKLHNPIKLINYVKNSQEIVLINNLETDLPIIDNYLLQEKPRSILALPLTYQAKFLGVIYLHSSQIKGLFHPEKTVVLEFLCSQAAIAIHNAQLFADASLKSKAIASSVDGMAILDNGLFTYLNESHLNFFGYELAELSGKSWEKLYSSEEINRFHQEVFPRLNATGKWSGEVVAQHKDGTSFPQEVSLFSLEDGKLICICRDISNLKAAKKALEISAIRDKTIFEQASVGFLEMDVATQKFTRVNQVFCQMTGYSAEELSQIKFQELTNPEDLGNCLELFQQLITGEIDKFFTEKRFLNKNGDYFWCETTAYPIEFEDNSIKTIFTIIKDISDRKKLEEQQQRLNAILEATSDYIGCADVAGNILWHNKPMRELRQDSLTTKITKKVSSSHPDWVNEMFAKVALPQAIAEGTWSGETILLDAEGKEIPVSQVIIAHKNATGEVEYFSTIMRDISQQKIVEEQLRISEQRYASLAAAAPVGIFRTDANGHCIYVNERACQISGLSPEDSLAQGWSNRLHEDDQDKIVAEWYQSVQEKRPFQLEYRFQRPDGSITWVFGQAIAEKNSAGETIGFVGTVTDISDLKAIKRQLEFTQYGLDHAADCFYCLDDEARILQVNHATCQRTGYTKEELLSMTIHDLSPTCPKELTWQSHWNKLKRLKSYSFESVHQTSDGEIFPVEVVCNYLEFDGKAYSFDLVRDVTERHQAQAALMEQQNHLAALLDNIPHLAWLKDQQSRFIAVNQPFAQACGTPIEDIVGKTDYDVWSAELAQKYRDDDFQVLSSGQRKVIEEQVIHPDGTRGWLETTKTPFKNADGEFTGTVGIAADLTLRKQAELALAESEAKFRTLVENAEDIIFSMTADGIFTYISPQVEQILGYSTEEFIGNSYLSFTHPDDISLVNKHLKIMIKQGTKISGLKIRLPKKNGGWRWVTFNNTPIKDSLGKIFTIQGIGRDITEKEQKEQALTAIVEGTAAKTGADFYRSCVRYLTDIFQVQYGFIAKLTPEFPLKSIMLVLWDGQQLLEPYEMELADTPCLETYQKNIYIAYDSLSELFPQADRLTTLNMESYASVAVFNSQGQVTANLGIMDSKPLPRHSSTLEFILQLFATRIGAEMERQETEDALRKSQTQLEAFINNSPSVIYQKDLQGRYQIFNQNLVNLFDLDRDTFIGHTDFEIFPDNIAQQFSKNDQQVIVSKTATTFEEEVPHTDGSMHIYIGNKFPLLDEQGQVYAIGGISTDITTLKQIELALQESKAQFQRITENVPGMIYRYVIHPDGNDELTYVSSQVKKIFEIEPQSALQNSDLMWARIHPDDVSIINHDLETSAEILQPSNIYFRLITPKKGIRWVQDMSRPEQLDNGDIVWDGIVIDITERKSIEAKQQRQLEILETTSDFIGTADPQGKILYLNEAWRNLLTQDGEEPCKREIIAEQHPAWALDIILNEALPAASELGMWSGETAILDANGREIPVSQVIIAHKSNNDKVEYFSTIIRDISDRKQVEIQLQQTNEQLARATRLKDEFLANMSHELRTPLNAILGMTEILQEKIFGDINQKQKKAIRTIEQSGAHLLELIDEILDLTKIESGHVELEYSTVDISQLCQASLALVKQQAQKKLIQLHLNMPFDLPNIRVDERRIRQVLINLLSNAIKFTPEEGSVTLEVKILLPDEISNQNRLSFAVKDTGIGIAEQDLNKLFQPFVQIDSSLSRQYEGTGLGLFLVKRIIDLHQGQISVKSELGAGSCFAIELPYPDLSTTNSISPSTTESNPIIPEIEQPSLAPLVLLAEDNDANSSIISLYLQNKGYRLQLAKNGETAIELAQAELPDIILMDIQMPDMDGLTAIKYIRQLPNLAQIPIIALTAFAMEQDRDSCLDAGANLYFSKPIRLKKLVLSIQQLLNSSGDR